jgi:hypothetical protein
MNVKFLIVEDEPTFRTDCCRYIGDIVCETFQAGADYSFEIVQAECEREATCLLKEATRTKQPFDLMILDLAIPACQGGFPTIECKRQANPSLQGGESVLKLGNE